MIVLGFTSWHQKYYSSLSSCQNASLTSQKAFFIIKLIYMWRFIFRLDNLLNMAYGVKR